MQHFPEEENMNGQQTWKHVQTRLVIKKVQIKTTHLHSSVIKKISLEVSGHTVIIGRGQSCFFPGEKRGEGQLGVGSVHPWARSHQKKWAGIKWKLKSTHFLNNSTSQGCIQSTESQAFPYYGMTQVFSGNVGMAAPIYSVIKKEVP